MNTTTLNMTNLDGGVIIKKGGGGGVPIQNQDKVVDITENGTTEVVADDGYTGLGKVTINTEVQGGGGGGSEYEYFTLTHGWSEELGESFAILSSLVKTETSTLGKVILPALYAQIVNDGVVTDPVAIALDMSLMVNVMGQQITIKDALLEGGATEESLAKYRITKEQFYALE